jgi:hypothetical protein
MVRFFILYIKSLYFALIVQQLFIYAICMGKYGEEVSAVQMYCVTPSLVLMLIYWSSLKNLIDGVVKLFTFVAQ